MQPSSDAGARASVALAIALGLGVSCIGSPAPARTHARAVEARAAPPAPSGVAAELAAWIAATSGNNGRPFAIIDKVGADIFVFDADGRSLGAAPVLVGLARGDDSPAGIGNVGLADIRPEERTTPAGRFVASWGPASGARRVLWIDYADSISLHPVVTTNPKERRLQRIRSAEPDDHRISFGCINVPAAFYKDVVLKVFGDAGGVFYILPDTKPVEDVFPGFTATAAAADVPDEPPVAAAADP